MSHEDQIFCGGKISLWEKAKEYVVAIVSECSDDTRLYLHEKLAAYYGLKPSDTRHITDNLPIPVDFYDRQTEATIAKCASIITNDFEELRRRKKEGTNDKS